MKSVWIISFISNILTLYVCVLRALEFICVFLESVVGGEEDLVKSANKAYDESLRKYHGWIVRGIFSVSLQCLPLLGMPHTVQWNLR